MQRPWNKDDFIFCYSFVTDFIYKWQNQINEPLYKLDVSINRKFNTIIGNVDLSTILEYAFSYSYDFMQDIELFYVDRKLKAKLDKLIVGNIYKYKSFIYDDDIHISDIEYQCKLLGLHKKLVTNNPQRWEIMIWYEYIPLSWKKTDYKKDKLDSISPNINTASPEEISQIYPPSITVELAQKVVALRKAIGKIKTVEDLEKIKGITKDQINWISRYSRK